MEHFILKDILLVISNSGSHFEQFICCTNGFLSTFTSNLNSFICFIQREILKPDSLNIWKYYISGYLYFLKFSVHSLTTGYMSSFHLWIMHKLYVFLLSPFSFPFHLEQEQLYPHEYIMIREGWDIGQ